MKHLLTIAPRPLWLFITISVLLVVPGSAAAAGDCPPKRATIVKKALGRIWHQGASLYGCTVVYSHRPRPVRLGPWSSTTRVAFDGVNVAWTARRTVAGRRVDRIWAANIDSRSRWLNGARLVPPSHGAPAREARAHAVLLRDQGVAWITQGSDLVLALRSPQDEPQPIGTASPSVKPYHHYLLLGTWNGVAPAELAASTKLTELPGEGDECGAVNPYELTVQVGATAPQVGVRWSGYWSSTNCS